MYRAFADSLTEPVAELVMELLFTQPTDGLATQADVHANTTLLRGEMAELRADVHGEMVELRGEMAELRSEFRGDIAEFRGEMKVEIGNLYRWGAGIIVANGVAVITALIT